MLHRRRHKLNILTSSVCYIPMKLRLSRSVGAAALRFYEIMRKGLLQNSPFFLGHIGKVTPFMNVRWYVMKRT